jgi:hypothetical protein
VKFRAHLRPILTVVVFLTSFAWLASGVHVGGDGDSPPFFIDEAHKIAETCYWDLFVAKRDFHAPAWSTDFYARTNPTVPKYVFGTVLAAAGCRVRDTQLQDDFENLWRQPAVLRARVPDRMLLATRLTSVVFGSLLCATLFAIGHKAGGAVTGLLAVALVLLNPYFQYYTRLGLNESLLMLLLLVVVPVTWWAASALDRYRTDNDVRRVRRLADVCLFTVIIPGATIALATGTKLTGALTAIAYAGGVSLAVLRRPEATGTAWSKRLASALVSVLLATLLAVAFFVALNPYYYSHPLSRFAETLHACQDWTVKQQIDPGGGLFDLKERASAVGHFLLRSRLLPLPEYLGVAGTWITTLGFVAGLAFLAIRAKGRVAVVKVPASAPDSPRDAAILLVWAATCIIGTVVWLPLVWRRYLLVPYPAACLLAACGLAYVPDAISAFLDALRPLAGPRGRWPSLMLLAGGVLAWVVLTWTSWVIAPELLEPAALSDLGATDQHALYASAVRRDPESAVLHRNFGASLMRQGKNDDAVRQIEEAIGRLPRAAADSLPITVQRAALLYDLTRARTALGDLSGARTAARDFVTAVRTLRDRMKSTDPKVRSEFDQCIADAERIAAGQAETRRTKDR